MANKLIWYPLGILLILDLVAFAFMSSSSWQNATGVVTNATNSYTFYFSLTSYSFLAIVIGAGGLVTAASIQLFGSGVNQFASRVIFNVGVWLGFWLILTGPVMGFIFSDGLNSILTYFYGSLTLVYSIGIAMLMGGHGD